VLNQAVKPMVLQLGVLGLSVIISDCEGVNPFIFGHGPMRALKLRLP